MQRHKGLDASKDLGGFQEVPVESAEDMWHIMEAQFLPNPVSSP